MERSLAFAAKAALGVVWFGVTYVTRFCINLAVAGAVVMYDRMLSLGRLAPRPVRSGVPQPQLGVLADVLHLPLHDPRVAAARRGCARVPGGLTLDESDGRDLASRRVAMPPSHPRREPT
jgi:hypothetical protein